MVSINRFFLGALCCTRVDPFSPLTPTFLESVDVSVFPPFFLHSQHGMNVKVLLSLRKVVWDFFSKLCLSSVRLSDPCPPAEIVTWADCRCCGLIQVCQSTSEYYCIKGSMKYVCYGRYVDANTSLRKTYGFIKAGEFDLQQRFQIFFQTHLQCFTLMYHQSIKNGVTWRVHLVQLHQWAPPPNLFCFSTTAQPQHQLKSVCLSTFLKLMMSWSQVRTGACATLGSKF